MTLSAISGQIELSHYLVFSLLDTQAQRARRSVESTLKEGAGL
jgi:hypothetical protein